MPAAFVAVHRVVWRTRKLLTRGRLRAIAFLLFLRRRTRALLTRSALAAAWVLARGVGIYRAHQFNKKVEIATERELLERWEAVVSTGKAALLHPSIGRSYDSAIARLARIEAKAVGIVQVSAVILALVAVLFTQTKGIIFLVNLVALAFVAMGTWGALLALEVRSYPQLLARDVCSESHGWAETAAAAEGMETRGIRATNFVVGAYSDVLRGGAAALMALALLVVARK